MTERMFPIQGTRRAPAGQLPWDFVAPHERRAQRNHDQSLTRLAERGGLDWTEALALIEDKGLYDVTADEWAARALVLHRLLAWKQQNGQLP